LGNSKWWIIASGPSLKIEDVKRLEGQNVIAINNSYALAPFATILYACDKQWWGWYWEDWIDSDGNHWPGAKHFKGEKWTQDKGWAKENNKIDEELLESYGLQWIESKAGSGISEDPDVIYQGSNSGIQAIGLAVHRGATEICLLGYDLSESSKPRWTPSGANGSQIRQLATVLR